jgi:spore germination protein KA
MRKTVSPVLEENIESVQQVFKGDKTLKHHRFQPAAVSGFRCCMFFIDGMVDSTQVNEAIIEPLVEMEVENCSENLAEYLEKQLLFATVARCRKKGKKRAKTRRFCSEKSKDRFRYS